MDKIFGKRHLVCDGPLNGSYVEAVEDELDEGDPIMVGVDPEIGLQYELGEWPNGERVWLHNRVPIALLPAVQEEFADAVADYWQNFQGQIEGNPQPLAERIREAVMDAEVR
jgi:hypothetical protein